MSIPALLARPLRSNPTPFPYGCVAWHDAQAVTGYSDGDTFSTWENLARGAYPMADGGTTNAIYRDGTTVEGINGNPACRIVASSTCYMNYANNPVYGYSAGEIFIVLQNDEDPPSSTSNAGLWYFNGADFNVHHPFTDGSIYETWGRANRVDCGNPTPALTSRHIYNVVSASGEYTVRLNGTTLYTTATNTPTFNSTNVRIGRSQGSPYGYAGLIGEVVIFNRALGSSERTSVYDYLDARW